MKKALKLFWLSILLTIFYGASTINAQVVRPVNNVPDYYYANYQFIDDWNAIWDVFSEIQSRYSLDMDVDSSYFRELHTHFQKTFQYLPKDYSTVYTKCTLLSEQLSNWATRQDIQWFLWNSCYNLLKSTASKITSSQTVKAKWRANVNWWMAPVTITFDARGSIDPSSETIPTENYFWYYRDENWVDTPMWKWNVINYEFKEAGKFWVHLVVRSSNVNQWILDGEQDLVVDISPKAANIVVYANTRKMSSNWLIKIWVSEWKKWIVFDWSATQPRWWRIILSHKWDIQQVNGPFSYTTKQQDGSPSFINVPLEWNWEFKVTLTTRDNENNRVSETFSLYMSDPVTVIKQTPDKWTTSTTITFDGSASYSITSRLNTFAWEIFDENWEKIHMDQGKKISKIFTKPWNYLVRLTVTDIAGNQNVDIKDVYIESTTPTPQFTMTATEKRTYPSEFTLDASNSSDIDVLNWVDSLSYSRKFSTDNVKIISTDSNNEKMVVQFNEVWKHTIKLTATDQYWKFTSISKTVEIKSTLRPEIEAIPWAITRWKVMQFKSTVNRPVVNYQWDFWDKVPWTNSQYASDITHIYGQRWIYTVTLTVHDENQNYNSVTEKVFIWETEYPIAAYRVKNSKWYFIQASDVCKITWSNWVLQEVDAYPVNRYDNFTINPSISVNTQWNSNWLKYAFEPESIMWENKASIRQDLTHRFSLTGCHYVDLTVQDSNVWKQDKTRIWFNVKNALPTIKNVTLSFPQYSDDNMVGFWATTSSNAVQFDCSWTNNLTIKVTAVNAADSDGTISRLRFYYYNVDDPSRILEYKETWTTAPYVYFVLPRIAWEYKFWVMVYDNDGGMIDSEEYLWSNPSIYFPASCWDSDVPTVSLKTSNQNIQVGDTVTYTIISRISSNNEDFETDRTFYYDFTWDWVRDLVTKKDTATYTFMEAYEDWVTPRAAVEYRWKVGQWKWAIILVRNGIKPIMLYNSIWNTVIFRDLSIWTFQQRQICFDVEQCWLWNTKFQRTHVVTTDITDLTWGTLTPITQNDSFIRKYDNYGQHNLSLYLKSKYWIEVKTWFTVKTTSSTNNWLIAPWVNIVTIPETTFTNANPEVFLSKAMNNTLLMYINNDTWETCYVDTDIATDSDWDGKTDNDIDISCNTIAKIVYQPNYESAIWRVYFMNNWHLTFKNFYVTFEWYILELNEEKLDIYKDITVLINGIEDISVENTDLKSSLDILRKNLNNITVVTPVVVSINEQIDNWWIKIDSKQRDLLNSVLDRLSNSDTIVSVWMSEYEKNRTDILAWIPKWEKSEMEILFDKFEGTDSKEEKAVILKWMRETISVDWVKSKKIDKDDVEILRWNFCSIVEYYDIYSDAGDMCSTDNSKTPPSSGSTATTWESSGLPWRLKIVLIILVWGLLAMGWVIIFFSIKARLNSASEEEDEW